MRHSRVILVASVVCLTVLCSRARADTIDIGALTFAPGFLTPVEFDVFNQTGSQSTPPAFPVLSTLKFTQLSIIATRPDNSTLSFLVNGAFGPGLVVGVSGVSPFLPNNPTDANFVSVALSGTVDLSQVSVNGNLVQFDPGSVTALLKAAPGQILNPLGSQSALITVTTPTIPEPSTLVLLGPGLGLVFLGRRRLRP